MHNHRNFNTEKTTNIDKGMIIQNFFWQATGPGIGDWDQGTWGLGRGMGMGMGMGIGKWEWEIESRYPQSQEMTV